MEKKNLIKGIVTFAFIGLAIFSLNAQAQKAQKRGGDAGNGIYAKGPGAMSVLAELSEEQKAKVKEIKAAHRKSVAVLKLDIQEKNIELKRIKLADKPEQQLIEQKIDEIFAIKADIMKSQVALHYKLSEVLTDEQMKKLRAVKKMKARKGKKSHFDKAVQRPQGKPMCRAPQAKR